MKATCNSNPKHDRFITVIHVTQDVIVDREGNFMDDAGTHESEITHGPNSGNTWICKECGAEATVTN